jgi:hypothetical protein
VANAAAKTKRMMIQVFITVSQYPAAGSFVEGKSSRISIVVTFGSPIPRSKIHWTWVVAPSGYLMHPMIISHSGQMDAIRTPHSEFRTPHLQACGGWRAGVEWRHDCGPIDRAWQTRSVRAS